MLLRAPLNEIVEVIHHLGEFGVRAGDDFLQGSCLNYSQVSHKGVFKILTRLSRSYLESSGAELKPILLQFPPEKEKLASCTPGLPYALPLLKRTEELVLC